MSWQIFTVISVLTLSLSVLLQRVLINRDKVDPYAYAVVFQCIVGVILTVAALVFGFRLPNIDSYVLPAIISILAFGIGHILYAKTLQHVEASAFSVLFATQAIWIMLLGIFLFQETLTILQILGSILIFASVLILIKNIKAFSLDKGTAYGLLTGLLFGIAITSWSYVGRYTDVLSWAAISFIGTALVAYLVRPKSIHKIQPLLASKLLPKLLLLGTLYAIGSLTMLYAYKEGAFSIVTPLRQTSIIVTVILALLFLKAERNNITKKLIAAAFCFLGVLLIVI